ncbi:MAG: hypothetical protein ACPHP7_05215 [Planctomycetota bacterium]
MQKVIPQNSKKAGVAVLREIMGCAFGKFMSAGPREKSVGKPSV